MQGIPAPLRGRRLDQCDRSASAEADPHSKGTAISKAKDRPFSEAEVFYIPGGLKVILPQIRIFLSRGGSA